jgi:hypothetical protein
LVYHLCEKKLQADEVNATKAYNTQFAYQQSSTFVGQGVCAAQDETETSPNRWKRPVKSLRCHRDEFGPPVSYIKGVFIVMSGRNHEAKTVEQGAGTTVTCATLPSGDSENGG